MPLRDDLYVLRGQTLEDSLSVGEWSIPNPKCEPYYFKVEMTGKATSYQFGFPEDASDTKPGWLVDGEFSQ